MNQGYNMNPGANARPLGTGYTSYEHDMRLDPNSWNNGGVGTGGGGGGGYPDPATLLQQMNRQYQNSYNEAKAANEQRYNQGMQGWDTLTRQTMRANRNIGNARAGELNRQFDALRGGAQQGLVDRGMAGSTIAPSVNAGIERQRGYALNDLNDQNAARRVGLMAQMGQGKLGFLERRQDSYPDMGQFAQLAMAMGAAGPNWGRNVGGGGMPAGMWGGGGQRPMWGGGGGNQFGRFPQGAFKQPEPAMPKGGFVGPGARQWQGPMPGEVEPMENSFQSNPFIQRIEGIDTEVPLPAFDMAPGVFPNFDNPGLA